MCGIFFYITSRQVRGKDKSFLKGKFHKIDHRGPDQKKIRYYNDNVMMGFHRLAIVDPEPAGIQPFESSDGRYSSIINGEIYNYKALKEEMTSQNIEWKTHSDCEVVVHLFQLLTQNLNPLEAMKLMCSEYLDGEYAMVIYDNLTGITYFGTDELSMRPLFIGISSHPGWKEYYLVSEQKALPSSCTQIIRLKGGHYGNIDLELLSDGGEPLFINKYYDLKTIKIVQTPFDKAVINLRDLLINNVINKLHPDREFVFLLSGGIDSSLVCAIAAKFLAPIRIKTFTVGFSEDATDILAARKVAKHIDSIHTEFICSYQEGLDILSSVIYHNESWDQTTTRASIPMALCVKKIREKHPDVAVIYSGEVADELLRGYLYNRNCPSLEEGREDQIMRLENLHTSDGLRADRTTSTYSMECRFPFFSRDILNFVLSLPMEYLDPKHNNNVEKFILRKAFDPSMNDGYEYLPHDILWRTKNAFSDATSVKSGWKEVLIKHCEKEISDSRFSKREDLYPYCTPQTKEDMFYREMSEEYGYDPTTIPGKWLSNWCGDITDSSATVLSVFDEDDI